MYYETHSDNQLERKNLDIKEHKKISNFMLIKTQVKANELC
jgi:hypothetical protein